MNKLQSLINEHVASRMIPGGLDTWEERAEAAFDSLPDEVKIALTHAYIATMDSSQLHTLINTLPTDKSAMAASYPYEVKSCFDENGNPAGFDFAGFLTATAARWPRESLADYAPYFSLDPLGWSGRWIAE